MNALLLTLLALAPQDALPEVPSATVTTLAAQVTHLVPGPRAQVLYLVDADFGLRAWSLKQEGLLWEVLMPSIPVVAMDVGQDSLVTTAGFAAFSQWSLEDGSAGSAIGGPDPRATTRCIAFDARDRWVWLGTSKGLMRLQPGNVNGWSTRAMDNGGSLCFARDGKGKALGVGGEDGSVRFVNPTSARRDEKRVFEVHEQAVSALAFDPKAKKLAAGAKDGALFLLEAKKGKRLHELVAHEKALCALAFDPRGELLASGDRSGQVLLWDVKEGRQVAKLQCALEGRVAGLAFVDKGKRLIGTTGGEGVVAWDLSEL